MLHSGREDAHGNIIDLYNKDDITYQFSVKFEHYFSKLEVFDNRIMINAYDSDRKESKFQIFKMRED